MHDRKYVPGGVDLVGVRLRNSIKMRDQDKVESFLITSRFLDNAPFKWVDMTYRYGMG